MVTYPIMFVRGYAIFAEVSSGRQLRNILQGNPMWMDETYDVHILEPIVDEGPLKELPMESSKQRFLILARLAKPVPPDLDYERTDRLLAQLRDEHGAQIYRLVEDVAGYALLLNIGNHDQIRTLLEPLPITPFVNYEIIPLGSFEGHRKHITALGLEDPGEASAAPTVG